MLQLLAMHLDSLLRSPFPVYFLNIIENFFKENFKFLVFTIKNTDLF